MIFDTFYQLLYFLYTIWHLYFYIFIPYLGDFDQFFYDFLLLILKDSDSIDGLLITTLSNHQISVQFLFESLIKLALCDFLKEFFQFPVLKREPCL
jgi:hypothetical protein